MAIPIIQDNPATRVQQQLQAMTLARRQDSRADQQMALATRQDARSQEVHDIKKPVLEQSAEEFMSDPAKDSRLAALEEAIMRSREFTDPEARAARKAKRKQDTVESELATKKGELTSEVLENNPEVYKDVQLAQLQETLAASRSATTKSGQENIFYHFGGVETPEDYARAYNNAPLELRRDMPDPELVATTDAGMQAAKFMINNAVTSLAGVAKATNPTPAASRVMNADIPQPDGSFKPMAVQWNPQTQQWYDIQGNPQVLPLGTRISQVGRTEADKESLGGMRSSEATALAYLNTTQQIWDQANKLVFTPDGQVDRENLLTASNVLGLQGVPTTEGRTLNALLGSLAANALFIRSGKQSRVDEKNAVINQLIPNALDIGNPELVRAKMGILKSLIDGSIDYMVEGQVDPERTLAIAEMQLAAAKEGMIITDTLEQSGVSVIEDPILGKIEIRSN